MRSDIKTQLFPPCPKQGLMEDRGHIEEGRGVRATVSRGHLVPGANV